MKTATSPSCTASTTPMKALREAAEAAIQAEAALQRRPSTPTGPRCTRRLGNQPMQRSATGSDLRSSDSDRPTLHRRDSSDTHGQRQRAGRRPRPAGAEKEQEEEPEDVGRVDSLPDVTDPDRPRLKRGKPNGNGLDVLPSLMGLPPDMQQAVAVSDAKSRPEHPWSYGWANPDDEAKMKSALEEIARDALGLKAPAAPAAAPRRTASRKKAKPAPPPNHPRPPRCSTRTSASSSWPTAPAQPWC